MGVDVNWSILQPVDVGGMFQQGMQEGQAQRRQSDWAQAMRDYARNPNDPAVHDRLIQLDPERGMMLRERAGQARERSIAAKRGQMFDSAAGRYMVGMRGGQGNALLPFATAAAGSPPALNALSAFVPSPPPVAASPTMPSASPSPANEAMPSAPAAGPVAAPVASAPAAAVDPEQAFHEMLAIDPVRAMQIESQGRDMVLARLRATDTAYEYAIRRIANVQDEAGYQAAITDLERQFAPLGVDLRANVPAAFPGPDGMRSLLMQALSAREQIAALDRQDRTDAYIDNINADNERADRNTDSLIADRSARTGIAVSREARIAAGGGGRGGGGRNRRPRRNRGGRTVTAVNPATGERIELVNGQWVPAQ